MATKHVVGTRAEIPDGGRKVVQIPGIGSVGVFRIGAQYRGVKNVCPHQGGPLCQGRLTGMCVPVYADDAPPRVGWVRQNEILRCPWHGWAFDIWSGAAVFRGSTRVAVYDVSVSRVGGDDDYVPTPAEVFDVNVESDMLVLEIPTHGRRQVDVGGARGTR